VPPKRRRLSPDSFAFSTSSPSAFWKNPRAYLAPRMLILPFHRPQPLRTIWLAASWEKSNATTAAWERTFTASPLRGVRERRHVDWKLGPHGQPGMPRFAREQEQPPRFLDPPTSGPRSTPGSSTPSIGCAFLAWRLSSRGAAIHVRLQGLRLPGSRGRRTSIPSEVPGLVYPQSAPPGSAAGRRQLQIGLHAVAAARFRDAGWMEPRDPDSDTLPRPPRRPEPARAHK